jgi:hypothetical protein
MKLVDVFLSTPWTSGYSIYGYFSHGNEGQKEAIVNQTRRRPKLIWAS